MSDVVEPVAEATEETTTEETTIDVAELAAQLEQTKKAQAGSDKAYQEAAKERERLKAENDKLRKASMDEKERADFERQEKERELAERESEINKATLRLSLVEALSAADMEVDFADFVPGHNKEEITENIGKLKELINTEVGKRVTETLNSTTKPLRGEPASGDDAVDTKGKSLQEIEKLISKRIATK
jgi:regulator of replication initiation timing